jgi:mannose-1-phosphate guanylyltransferase/mannose-6-phosphate isomerase
VSRQSFPKQFSRLAGDDSLFQRAARRFCGAGFAPPTIVTGNSFRFIVAEHLDQIGVTASRILIEPEGRNTAPAILAAALALAQHDPAALILAAPSDHVVPDDDVFRQAVRAAVPQALAGRVVTFGITPDRPETGYGYLELAPGADPAANQPQPLARFVEKPDADMAEAMLRSGRFLWNAGVFLFTAETLIDRFHDLAPEILTPVRAAVTAARADLGFTRLAAEPWRAVPDISIDYAIMEKLPDLAVMPFGGGWSDLGGWDAVWRETRPDADGNALCAHSTAIDCSDTLLRSDTPRVELVGIGLSGMIAVATGDAVLVARKSDAQKVKSAVTALKAKGAAQATEFATDHRPWGWFERVASGARFQVKRIVVKPGAALSLQSHRHRAEHWVVVEGMAEVTVGQRVQTVAENESVYVPRGQVHRLRNPGNSPMVLIEVQTGSYLGEDDIVRFEDCYARGNGLDA